MTKNSGMCQEKINVPKGEAICPNITANIPKVFKESIHSIFGCKIVILNYIFDIIFK